MLIFKFVINLTESRKMPFAVTVVLDADFAAINPSSVKMKKVT